MGVLSKEEAAGPGARLLAMLISKANEDGLALRELAAILGVTYGYIHQLRTGVREIKNVSDEFLSASASYLGIPRVTAMIAAEKLSAEDLFEPVLLETTLETAWRTLLEDRRIAPLISAELDLASANTKLLIIKLYERAEGRQLLPPNAVTRASLEAFLSDEKKQR